MKIFIIFLIFTSFVSAKEKNLTEAEECMSCQSLGGKNKLVTTLSSIPKKIKSKNNILSNNTHLTGYFPDSSRMEGGFKDRYGVRLYTLQEFLAGKAPYVSVAIDIKNGMKKYQKKILCIPELDKAYGSEMLSEVRLKTGGRILFKAVDTGGRFYYRGWDKMDICVANKKASFDKRLNHKVTVTDCN